MVVFIDDDPHTITHTDTPPTENDERHRQCEKKRTGPVSRSKSREARRGGALKTTHSVTLRASYFTILNGFGAAHKRDAHSCHI